MSELYSRREHRSAPDCWELVAVDHHPDVALRGVVVDVLPDDSQATLDDALTRIARGERARVVTP